MRMEMESNVKKREKDRKVKGVSPCLYYQNMSKTLINAGSGKKGVSIGRFIEYGVIDEFSLLLLKLIYRYRCVTCHVLGCLVKIEPDIPEEYRKRNVGKCIRKLASHGLIRKYELSYEKDGERCGVPCYYTLSLVAKNYVAKLYFSKGNRSQCHLYPMELSVEQMLKYGIFAKFHSVFLTTYQPRQYWIDYRLKKGLTSCVLEGVYQFVPEHQSGPLELVVLPIRSNEAYLSQLTQQLALLQYAIKEGVGIFHTVYLLLLCETSAQAIEVEEWMKKTPYFYMPRVYLLDTALMSGVVNHKIFTVEQTKEESVLTLKRFEFL